MKLFMWMSRMFFVSITAAAISLITTWLMLDLYAKQILNRFNLEDLRSNVQVMDVIGHAASQLMSIPQNTAISGDEETDPGSGSGSGDTPIIQEDGEDSSLELDIEAENEEDAIAVWGQQNSTERILSLDDFNQLKNSLSDEDKMDIFSLLFNSVPQEVLLELSFVLEDGLTQEEMLYATELLMEHLDEEEIEKLLQSISQYR